MANKQESITIERDLFEHMLSEFGHLMLDFEKIADQNMMLEAGRRIKDIEEGKVEPLSEKDFLGYLKGEGINVK